MKIIVGISHPKQVHFWKNIIINLRNKGHEVKIVAWDKEIVLYLLDTYGFRYEVVGKKYPGLINKAYHMFESDLILLKIVSNFKPDLLVGGAPYLAHVGKLTGTPHITITDTDHANLDHKLSFPFSNIICTPSCYKGVIDNKKHVSFNGYMELAYLDPRYFRADPIVIEEAGLTKEDRFIVIRLGSWSAAHDSNSKGIKYGSEYEFIKNLSQYGNVFISSERELPQSLEKYRLKIPPEHIHSFLSYAQLYIGEGFSMAAEAAILGTPSIVIEAVVLNKNIVDLTHIIGNADDLVNKYGLMFAFSNQEIALKTGIKILEDKKSKTIWQKKSEKLFKDKIDVTLFFSELIENYIVSADGDSKCSQEKKYLY
jgi:predicted glycosyltransferase